MLKSVLAVSLSLLALAASAQDKEKDPTKDLAIPPPGLRKVQIPLRLQIVFARSQGDRKVSSMPYTLSLMANGRSTRLRMGIEVPIQVKDAVQYRNVGNNLDCSAESLEESRFWLTCTLEQSLVYAPEGERRPAGSAVGELPLGSVPIVRNFRSESNLTLRDGQSATFLSATDPVSGEVLKVDVTLNVVR